MESGDEDATAHQPVRYAQRPESLRGLRACRSCRLIKTVKQFQDDFCNNCWRHWADGEPASTFKALAKLDIALENTTDDFEGMVAMMRPHDSWAARWLQMGACGGGARSCRFFFVFVSSFFLHLCPPFLSLSLFLSLFLSLSLSLYF